METLPKFVVLGAEIINTQSEQRYGREWPDRTLQPGFVPLKGQTKLAILNCNPHYVSIDDYPEWARSEVDEYCRWGKEATISAYEQAYLGWRQRVQNWNVFQTWVCPVLADLRLSIDSVAWLNAVKLPTKGAAELKEQMFLLDRAWLLEQLRLLNPVAILVGGKGVFRHIRKVLPPDFLERCVVQDRVRNKNASAREEDRGIIVKQLKLLLSLDHFSSSLGTDIKFE